MTAREERYLPTVPGTGMQWSTIGRRDRPCWRCRLRPEARRHWACRRPVRPLVYIAPRGGR